MIEVRWQILEEEGRAIKAVFDLSHVPCLMLPKRQVTQDHIKANGNNIIVDSLANLRSLAMTQPQLQAFFGKTEEQKAAVENLLQFYQSNVKEKLRLPILEYYKLYHLPLPRKFLSNKLKDILEGVKMLEDLLERSNTKFLSGNSLTIVDLLFYFDICNLIYFKKDHSKYPKIAAWFGKIYKQKKIKSITHQWFSMAKQITRTLQESKVQAHL